MDTVIHLGLFLFASAVIVAISCFFADVEDAHALKAFPRRFVGFLGGCLVVIVLMLVFEHTFASIH